MVTGVTNYRGLPSSQHKFSCFNFYFESASNAAHTMKLDKQQHTLHVKCNALIMKRYVSINLIPDSEISRNYKLNERIANMNFFGRPDIENLKTNLLSRK